MKKFVAAAAFVAFAFPALAQQQEAAEEQAAPKPSKAEVDSLVKAISADKARIGQYCEMVKLYNESYEVGEKDEKKAEELAEKADELGEKLGDDYSKVVDGLAEVDPESEEGKLLFAAFEPLDGSCPKN